MNANISVFVICAEAIMYLLLYNLHDFTFNVKCYQTRKKHFGGSAEAKCFFHIPYRRKQSRTKF